MGREKELVGCVQGKILECENQGIVAMYYKNIFVINYYYKKGTMFFMFKRVWILGAC